MKLFSILRSKLNIGKPLFHDYIIKVIKHTGPMNINNFMRELLTNSTHGYYMHSRVFGANGDFITSPEISQIFGELVGIWIVNEWNYQKTPKPFQIIELGPGRGTLMSDALTAISKFPDLLKIISIKFVEISEKMKKSQQESLEKCFHKIGQEIPVEWFDDLSKIPAGVASCYLAHEFFDALPIHKFRRNSDKKWRELLIDYLQTGNGECRLGFILSQQDTQASLAFRNILDKLSPFQNDFELSPLSLTILHNIATRIEQFGGFALVADYGHFGEKGDTFRAFRNHKLSDPLEYIGESDLTADVNFALFTDHLRDNFSHKSVLVSGPICQNVFLANMGIDVRLEMLLKRCKSKIEIDSLIWSYKIMMDRTEMGDRFKFLSILPGLAYYNDEYRPAGFRDLC